MKEKHKLMYMEMAKVAAKQSYAKRLQVGAIAVKDHRILSVGYNGTFPGADNNCENLIDGKLVTKKEVIHAEMNLIYKLARDGESGADADLFITHAPCFECAKAILSVGFKKVWFRNEYKSDEGIQLLKANGVDVEKVD